MTPRWRALFQLNPTPWRWAFASEIGVAMALSIGAWTIAGQQSLGLIASMGVFTGLYFSDRPRGDRARALPVIGIALSVVAALGVACSANLTLTTIGLILLTVIATLTTLGFNIGAPGPLIPVLIFGVSGYIAARARATGGPLAPDLIPLLLACGIAITCGVAAAPLAVRRFRQPMLVARETSVLVRPWSLEGEAKVIAARVIVTVTLASALGVILGIERMYWVVAAAVAVIQKSHSPHITTLRAWHRVLGTLAGLGLFAGLHQIELRGLWLAGVISLLQFAVELVVTRNYGLALMFITPIALTISSAGHAHSSLLLMETRLLDTVLGCAIALLVLWGSNRISSGSADIPNHNG
jgi:hypothetical protein